MKPTLTTTTYVHFEVGEDTGKNREKNRYVPTAAERKTRIKSVRLLSEEASPYPFSGSEKN